MLTAIQQILDGRIYLSQSVSNKILLKVVSGNKPETDNPLDHLSDRELEVFELTGKGLSTREIALKLHISIKTVEFHRANIKEKLQLSSSTEMIRHVIRWYVDTKGINLRTSVY